MIKQRWGRRAGMAAALLLALSITMMGSTVYAQEGSPSAQASPVVQQEENNDVPWGLLGLLGLGGLAGLRRRPESEPEGPRPTRRL